MQSTVTPQLKIVESKEYIEATYILSKYKRSTSAAVSNFFANETIKSTDAFDTWKETIVEKLYQHHNTYAYYINNTFIYGFQIKLLTVKGKNYWKLKIRIGKDN